MTISERMMKESALIGKAIRGDDKAVKAIVADVSADDFSAGEAKKIAEIIKNKAKNGDSITPSTVSLTAGRACESYIDKAYNNALKCKDPEGYAAEIHTAAYIEKIHDFAAKLTELTDYEAIVAKVAELKSVQSKVASRKMTHISDLLMNVAEEAAQHNVPDIVSTGIPLLDENVKIRTGSYVTLCALTSVGKTVLAVQIGLEMAKQGKRVCYYSYEMEDKEVAERIASRNASHTRLINGHASDADINSIRKTAEELKKSGFYVFHASDYTANDISAHAISNNIDVVIVDYIQTMPDYEYKGHFRSVAENSKTLENLAKNTGKIVIATCQLNPYQEETDDGVRVPDSSLIRDCREIGMHADYILMLYKESPGEKVSRRILWVEKSRGSDGACTRVFLDFCGDQQVFEQSDDQATLTDYYEPEEPRPKKKSYREKAKEKKAENIEDMGF